MIKLSYQRLLDLIVGFPAFLFVPYLAVYLLAWGIKLPLNWVEKAFWILHFFNLALIVHAFLSYYKKITVLEWLFWGGLFAVLWNRGAYLEYPSDPWDHFRRITLWNDYQYIFENPHKNRVPYFFGWTLIKYFPPNRQRFFLDLYSAFWQWLLCYQFARFFLKLGITRERITLFVVATIVFFGSGMLSFRYYMLSGVPLGYVAYLGALSLFLKGEWKSRFAIVAVPLLSALMLFSHPETLLFFFLSLLALWLSELLLERIRSRGFYFVLLFGYFLSLVIGYGLYFKKLFPFNSYSYADLWTPQLSKLSTFRVWDLQGRFFETLAVPGVLAVLYAFYLVKKQPKIVALCLFPLCLAIFPPAVLLMIKTFHYDTAYRILYMFPTAVLLAFFVDAALNRTNLPDIVKYSMGIAVILALGAPYQYPWRGRLFFQIHRPKPLRSLVPLDETAQWYFENRKDLPKNCYIMSDDLSSFSLYTHLGKRKYMFDRPAPLYIFKGERMDSLSQIERFVAAQLNGRTICGILVARKAEIPPPAYSIVSLSSRLWPPQRGDLAEYIREESIKAIPDLLHRGWTKTQIPPFYDLYEPPYLTDLPPPINYPAE